MRAFMSWWKRQSVRLRPLPHAHERHQMRILENSLLFDPLLAGDPDYAFRSGTSLRPQAYGEVSTMRDRLLRRREVEELVGLSRASIYRLRRSGGFPRPVRVSSTAVRWRESDIHAWIQSRPTATTEVGSPSPPRKPSD